MLKVVVMEILALVKCRRSEDEWFTGGRRCEWGSWM